MRVGVLVSRRSVSSVGSPCSHQCISCIVAVPEVCLGLRLELTSWPGAALHRFGDDLRHSGDVGLEEKKKANKKPPTLSQLFAKDPEGEIVPLLASEAPEVGIHRELMQLFLGSEGTNLKCRV